jgi:hypothetical protein
MSTQSSSCLRSPPGATQAEDPNNCEHGQQSKAALQLSDKGLTVVKFNNVNVPINDANDIEPHAQRWHLCKLALVALLGGKGSSSIRLLVLCICYGLHKPTHAFWVTTKYEFVVGMAQMSLQA